jgi:hypothetical protein
MEETGGVQHTNTVDKKRENFPLWAEINNYYLNVVIANK